MNRYYTLNDNDARIAHEMNSFREFRSDSQEYREKVDSVYNLAEQAAERAPERKEEAYGLADTYARKLAEWYNRSYVIESMCPSVLICGAGNFPTRKKERQNAARDKHMSEYNRLDAIVSKIMRIGTTREPIRSGDADVVEKLKAKIETLEALQEEMKAANAKARKEHRDVPYPPYKLSNNRQKLTNAKKRLAHIESTKAQGNTERDTSIMGEPVHVVENAATMRLQLMFEDKPDADVRTALKERGFRWAPSVKAWQRSLGRTSLFLLKELEAA